jgi:hypothetical protein
MLGGALAPRAPHWQHPYIYIYIYRKYLRPVGFFSRRGIIGI